MTKLRYLNYLPELGHKEVTRRYRYRYRYCEAGEALLRNIPSSYIWVVETSK